MLRQGAVAVALVVDAAAIGHVFQHFLQSLRSVGTVGPHPAIVLIRLQHLGQKMAIVGRCRRGLVVAHQLVPAIHRHVVLIAQGVHPVLLRPYAASMSFCASLQGVSFHASGTLALFQGRVLCAGVALPRNLHHR